MQTVTWWRKKDDEFRAVMRVENSSKVGRAARLRGTAQTVALIAP
jgi:hypothetical protein